MYFFLLSLITEGAYINKERAPIEAAWRGDRHGAPCRYKQMHLSYRDVKNCFQLAVVG